MTAHAKLGASNAHRWLVCAGSVAAEEGLEDKTSPFAEEGTRAHEMAESCLAIAHSYPEHVDFDDWPLYAQVKSEEYLTHIVDDPEMGGHVAMYVDYVNRLIADCDLYAIEQRVEYSDWVDNGFGTADAIVLSGNVLHVCDLKYGMGVRVDAEDNPQGMLYALGAYAKYSKSHVIDVVRIAIVQPRLDHISEWEISVERLLGWAEWVSQRAEATQEENAERVPGEKQCRFCKAKATCAALKDYTESIIMADFDDLDDLPKANTLNDDALRKALDAKPLIEGWLSAVERVIKERLEGGDGFSGYKLVEGRSQRRWTNEKAAQTALVDLVGEDKAFNVKLISPSQAEKVLGKSRKGDIEGLITKPSGAPTLAPETDNRPAINLSADDFDVIDE